MFRQLQANRGLVVVRILSSQNAAATRHTHGERRRPRRTRIRDYFVRITHVKRCWPHAALKKGSTIINQAIKVKYGQTSKKNLQVKRRLVIHHLPPRLLHPPPQCVDLRAAWWDVAVVVVGWRRRRRWWAPRLAECVCVFRSEEELQRCAPGQNQKTCKRRQLAPRYV